MALPERRLLLRLDNVEHLFAQGIAAFVRDLLEHCTHLHMLVTSREPLRVSSEQRFLTPPCIRRQQGRARRRLPRSQPCNSLSHGR